MNKLEITLQVEIDDSGKPSIIQSSVVPITPNDVVVSEVVGKQPEPQPQVQNNSRQPIPAPVGQTPTSGKSDWFKGTTWGN